MTFPYDEPHAEFLRYDDVPTKLIKKINNQNKNWEFHFQKPSEIYKFRHGLVPNNDKNFRRVISHEKDHITILIDNHMFKVDNTISQGVKYVQS